MIFSKILTICEEMKKKLNIKQMELPGGAPKSTPKKEGKKTVNPKSGLRPASKIALKESEVNDRRFFVEGMDFVLRNRKKDGLTRGKLAEQVGISGAYLSMLLNPAEKGNFDIDLAARIAHGVGYSLSNMIALGRDLLVEVIGDPSPPSQVALLEKVFIGLKVNPSFEQRAMLKNILDTIIELEKAG